MLSFAQKPRSRPPLRARAGWRRTSRYPPQTWASSGLGSPLGASPGAANGEGHTPYFAGLFLDKESKALLLARVPACHAHVHADHVTLQVKPSLAWCEDMLLPLVGSAAAITVQRAIADERCQAVAVDIDAPAVALADGQRRLHITISTAEGVRAASSNELLASAASDSGHVESKGCAGLRLSGILGVAFVREAPGQTEAGALPIPSSLPVSAKVAKQVVDFARDAPPGARLRFKAEQIPDSRARHAVHAFAEAHGICSESEGRGDRRRLTLSVPARGRTVTESSNTGGRIFSSGASLEDRAAQRHAQGAEHRAQGAEHQAPTAAAAPSRIVVTTHAALAAHLGPRPVAREHDGAGPVTPTAGSSSPRVHTSIQSAIAWLHERAPHACLERLAIGLGRDVHDDVMAASNEASTCRSGSGRGLSPAQIVLGRREGEMGAGGAADDVLSTGIARRRLGSPGDCNTSSDEEHLDGGSIDPRLVVIVRGLPGSGKSTAVAAISRAWAALGDNVSGPVVCSADHFFEDGGELSRRERRAIRRDGSKSPPAAVTANTEGDADMSDSALIYAHSFDPALLRRAHAACRAKFEEALRSRAPLVVVDNTHTRRDEYAYFRRRATSAGFAVAVVEIACSSENEAKACGERSAHAIPARVQSAMWRRWEPDADAAVLGVLPAVVDLAPSASSAPPCPGTLLEPLNQWLCTHHFIHRDKRRRRTHLQMHAGDAPLAFISVPPRARRDFLLHYAADPGPTFLCEALDPRGFRFFVDVDIPWSSSALDGARLVWLARALQRVLQCPPLNERPERCRVVVTAARAVATERGGVAGFRSGVHLHVPGVIVHTEAALAVRAALARQLAREPWEGGADDVDWDAALDPGVYNDGCGLRMLGSLKVKRGAVVADGRVYRRVLGVDVSGEPESEGGAPAEGYVESAFSSQAAGAPPWGLDVRFLEEVSIHPGPEVSSLAHPHR